MSELLRVENISKTFLSPQGKRSSILEKISFTLQKGEIMALLGESGSGKSTLARIIAGLIPPDQGQILWKGENLQEYSHGQLKELRRKMQIVFQDSYASLNQYFTVERIIEEPLKIHGLEGNVEELLMMVGLEAELKKRYPRELSGGQCRRINLARSLALKPILLLADELTSGLDINVQKDLLDLLLDLKKKLNLTCLFISHDLDAVRYLADRVGVMKNGRLLELSLLEEIFTNPQNSYVQELLSCQSLF